MNWLLTWNPLAYPFDELPELSSKLLNSEPIEVQQNWSTGNTTSVKLGDKVFLLRQGPLCPGLVGSGIATSFTWEGPRFDDPTRMTNYVDVDWDVLINPEIHPVLSRDDLNQGITSVVNWNTQASGINIDKNHSLATVELVKKWEAHLKQFWKQDS